MGGEPREGKSNPLLYLLQVYEDRITGTGGEFNCINFPFWSSEAPIVRNMITRMKTTVDRPDGFTDGREED